MIARHRPFATLDNFRDYGDYATASGPRIRAGRLFRSANHARLSDPDLASVAAYDIGTVVDLRRPVERNAQPSRRPADGRYGQNPFRLVKHQQFQVVMKPAPDDIQDLYVESLVALGIDPKEHDLRFEEDNWESPTLGAWGIGWQVLFDGMEISQFTYFQQAGGLELAPISAELTSGLERIAMVLQRVDRIYDIEWAPGVKYADVRLREEIDRTLRAKGLRIDGPTKPTGRGNRRFGLSGR